MKLTRAIAFTTVLTSMLNRTQASIKHKNEKPRLVEFYAMIDANSAQCSNLVDIEICTQLLALNDPCSIEETQWAPKTAVDADDTDCSVAELFSMALVLCVPLLACTQYLCMRAQTGKGVDEGVKVDDQGFGPIGRAGNMYFYSMTLYDVPAYDPARSSFGKRDSVFGEDDKVRVGQAPSEFNLDEE